MESARGGSKNPNRLNQGTVASAHMVTIESLSQGQRFKAVGIAIKIIIIVVDSDRARFECRHRADDRER